MRDRSLYELAGYGTHYLPLAEALERRDRARGVDLGGAEPDGLRGIRRLMRLDLGRTDAPPWLGELRHLRMLSSKTLSHVPEAIWTLPKLREIYLESPTLAEVAGLEKSTSIRSVFLGRTPLGADKAKIDAILASIPGAKYEMGFLDIARTPAPRPTDKLALVQAINDDTLDDFTDLSGADLSGATFEDCLFLQDLSGANLRNARFRRCDLSLVMLGGADLSEAVFEDCFVDLSARPADEVVAPGVRFERCALRLSWNAADLRGARFVDLESNPRLDFTGARAEKLELAVVVTSESEVDVSFEGADLRGAKIAFDIAPSRRAELTAKPNPRLKWATGQFEGAKTDASTEIVYAPLPAKPVAAKKARTAKGKKAKAGFELDDNGPSAPALARIGANNASLWLLAIDAASASAWAGADGEDFDRALDVEEGGIEVGDATGVVTQVGDCGWSHVWKVDGGVALICHYPSGHTTTMANEVLVRAVGARVAQFPFAKPERTGTIEITTGCLALLVPYENGKFSEQERAEGKTQPMGRGGRALIPLPNGTYDVLGHSFAPKRGYEDELGSYGACVRIVRTSK